MYYFENIIKINEEDIIDLLHNIICINFSIIKEEISNELYNYKIPINNLKL